MHDSLGVRVFLGLQDFVGLKVDFDVSQAVVELLGLKARDVFENKARHFLRCFKHDIEECNDVRATKEFLEDRSFPINLLRAHGLQDFNHALLVV